MPLLTDLNLRTDLPTREIEDEILELFAGLDKLQKVVFPRYHFTTRIAEDHLGIVEFQYDRSQGYGALDSILFFGRVHFLRCRSCL